MVQILAIPNDFFLYLFIYYLTKIPYVSENFSCPAMEGNFNSFCVKYKLLPNSQDGIIMRMERRYVCRRQDKEAIRSCESP